MTNKQIAGLLDLIRDKNSQTLTKDEMQALISAANILRETEALKEQEVG